MTLQEMLDQDRESYIEGCLDEFRKLDHEIVCRFATIYKTIVLDLYGKNMGKVDDYMHKYLYMVRDIANETENGKVEA